MHTNHHSPQFESRSICEAALGFQAQSSQTGSRGEQLPVDMIDNTVKVIWIVTAEEPDDRDGTSSSPASQLRSPGRIAQTWNLTRELWSDLARKAAVHRGKGSISHISPHFSQNKFSKF